MSKKGFESALSGVGEKEKFWLEDKTALLNNPLSINPLQKDGVSGLNSLSRLLVYLSLAGAVTMQTTSPLYWLLASLVGMSTLYYTKNVPFKNTVEEKIEYKVPTHDKQLATIFTDAEILHSSHDDGLARCLTNNGTKRGPLDWVPVNMKYLSIYNNREKLINSDPLAVASQKSQKAWLPVSPAVPSRVANYWDNRTMM